MTAWRTKEELRGLADGLILNAPDAVRDCVEFVLSESQGHWHNRARAMMCRRLKHCELSAEQQTRLVGCILDRLRDGRFSEQFRDQLRFVLHVDRAAALEGSRRILSGPARDHVRRYAQWVLQHHA